MSRLERHLENVAEEFHSIAQLHEHRLLDEHMQFTMLSYILCQLYSATSCLGCEKYRMNASNLPAWLADDPVLTTAHEHGLLHAAGKRIPEPTAEGNRVIAEKLEAVRDGLANESRYGI